MQKNTQYLAITALIVLTLMATGSATAQTPTFKMIIGNTEFGAVDQLRGPSGVAIYNGELYVVEQTGKEVSVFTLDGVYQRKFGPLGTSPEKMAIDAAGNSYVTDSTDNVVKKFDAAGNFVLEWGSYGAGDGQFNKPTGITFDADGNLWINDRFNYRFVKYDTDGNQLSATLRDVYDNTGATDIVFGADGLIYATMWAQNYNRVSVFDTAGVLQRYSNTYQGPQGIDIAPNGRIGIVSWNWHQAHILEAADTMADVVTWGDSTEFNFPIDIVFGTNGDIFIADKSMGRVRVYTSDLVPTAKTSLGSVKSMFR